MPQGEADRNLRDFLAGKVDVMVSTNLASRGIDFVDVEHVVQFHFAQSLVDHIHRVGRTGRGGRSGEGTPLRLFLFSFRVVYCVVLTLAHGVQ
jgi:superfamily II DNA/RNA helicase